MWLAATDRFQTSAGKAAAEQVAAEPWAEGGPLLGFQPHPMWEQFRNLGSTIRYAHQTATPDQMTAIAAQLEAVRKTILATLAEN